MYIGKEIIKEIESRLRFLALVGLDYLTLDRRANTLSGGESQRIRLATQIGTRLTGVMYVLDDASIEPVEGVGRSCIGRWRASTMSTPSSQLRSGDGGGVSDGCLGPCAAPVRSVS